MYFYKLLFNIQYVLVKGQISQLKLKPLPDVWSSLIWFIIIS